MSRDDFAKDYIPVADRISAFREKYPEGSLQSEILSLTDTQVLIKGYAYRTPDDPRPGIGHAAEVIPGRTPYTKDSEVEVAETSAWGRAIAALGFEVKHGIATAEDVQKRSGAAEQPRPQQRPQQPAPAPQRAPQAPTGGMTVGQALEALKGAGIDPKTVSAKGKELYGQWSLKEMSPEQRAHVVEELVNPPAAADDIWDGMETAA